MLYYVRGWFMCLEKTAGKVKEKAKRAFFFGSDNSTTAVRAVCCTLTYAASASVEFTMAHVRELFEKNRGCLIRICGLGKFDVIVVMHCYKLPSEQHIVMSSILQKNRDCGFLVIFVPFVWWCFSKEISTCFLSNWK